MTCDRKNNIPAPAALHPTPRLSWGGGHPIPHGTVFNGTLSHTTFCSDTMELLSFDKMAALAKCIAKYLHRGCVGNGGGVCQQRSQHT